jgi:hypothetical protein
MERSFQRRKRAKNPLKKSPTVIAWQVVTEKRVNPKALPSFFIPFSLRENFSIMDENVYDPHSAVWEMAFQNIGQTF